MKDLLGERIKTQYENRTRYSIPRRTYTIVRLDGKAFHTYTRGLLKPFDHNLYSDMNEAVIAMMPHIQGAVFAYTQSDEISVLVQDFSTSTTCAWFDGNIQKMASVSASVITAEFNKLRWNRFIAAHSMNLSRSDCSTAYFDSRIFTIPDRTEVMNYFIWRNQDCTRNSISMYAQSLFSHKDLQGKSTVEMLKMLDEYKDGTETYSWNALNPDLRFGRLIVKEMYNSKLNIPYGESSDFPKQPETDVLRTRWVVKPAWRFTEDKERLVNMIPKHD